MEEYQEKEIEEVEVNEFDIARESGEADDQEIYHDGIEDVPQ